MTESTILDKIKKLMALSQSSNEHEAMLALTKARELMTEYKISQGEVDSHQFKSQKIVKRTMDTWCTKYNDPWIMTLGCTIANAHCCGCYVSQGYRKRTIEIVMMGYEDDIAIAEMVFLYALNTILTDLKYKQVAWKDQLINCNSQVIHDLRNSYAIGFIKGIKDNYNKQDTECSETAIVLSTPQEVKNYLDNLSSRVSGQYNRFDQSVMSDGYDQGSKFDTNRMTSGAHQLQEG